jgi:hypothetical protein
MYNRNTREQDSRLYDIYSELLATFPFSFQIFKLLCW